MTGTGLATSYAEAPASAYFAMPTALVFDVGGRDAPRYLNARLTNDMKTMPIGSCCLAAALTAQGKTQGLFRVLRLEESRYVLVADGGDREAVLASLKKFIVADRVDVTDITAEVRLLHSYGSDEALEKALGGGLPTDGSFAEREQVKIVRSERLARNGYDLIAPIGEIERIRAALEESGAVPLDGLAVEAYRIRYGRPAFPVEIGEERLFLESGMKEALSFSKGCYVGQEVVEKIESHGKLPRKLCRVVIEGTAPLEPGAQVASAAGPIGTLLSFAALDEHTYCFVTVKPDQAPAGLPVTVGGARGVIM